VESRGEKKKGREIWVLAAKSGNLLKTLMKNSKNNNNNKHHIASSSVEEPHFSNRKRARTHAHAI
jgi:hypothetical protein